MVEYDADPKESTEAPNDQYDSPWKEAVEHYLPEFMAFYFPDASAEIDWAKDYVFLDKELRAVVQDAELGTRFVDKLVGVELLNGDASWIYIHLEVQGTRQAEFAQRMFVYNYRIYDRYKRPVASFAVLADEHKSWKPSTYGFALLGSKHTLEFPVAKLTDYEDKLEELLASENAFGLITAAHILTQQTRKHEKERYEAKRRLVRILYDRHWDKERVIKLFAILDWLMQLPEWLNRQILDQIETIEEGKKVQYITSVERIGMARGEVIGVEKGVVIGEVIGMEKGEVIGMEKGEVIGMEKGVVIGRAGLLRRQLECRFGVLPEWALGALSGASEQELDAWGVAVLTAPTLEAVFNTY